MICNGIVREVYKEFIKLQTSSRYKPSERDITLLRTKINSNKVLDMATTPESNLRKSFASKSAATQHGYHAK